MALPRTLNRPSTPTPWPGRTTPVSRTDRVVFLGDSIVEVYPFMSCYLTMVNNMCGTGTKPTFINSGHGGDCIGNTNGPSSIVGQEATRVIQYSPTILVVFVGINDVSIPTTNANFEARYNSVLDTCLASIPTLKIVLCSPIVFGGVHPEGSNTVPYGSVQDPRISGYRDIISGIASARNLTFIDYRAMYFAEPQQPATYWVEPLASALHPSDIGQVWTSTILLRAMPFVP